MEEGMEGPGTPPVLGGCGLAALCIFHHVGL